MNFKRGLLRLVAETEKNQARLGEEAGISQTTVTSWATGRSKPTLALIERLVEPQDVKASTFISWCEE